MCEGWKKGRKQRKLGGFLEGNGGRREYSVKVKHRDSYREVGTGEINVNNFFIRGKHHHMP